jgi:hypothetical protein
MRSPSTLHVGHHDGSTTMTSRCTKSFHTLRSNDVPFTKVKFTIPPFYGLYDVEAYLDLEMTIDNKFSSHLVPEQYHVR